MNEVTITASGSVGSGKSALLGEIEVLLRALNIPYRYADERAAAVEKALTHADWIGELERTKPCVVLKESNPNTEDLKNCTRYQPDALFVARSEARRETFLMAANECDTAAAQSRQTVNSLDSREIVEKSAAVGAALQAQKLAARLRELAQ
jgi:hypothetical protein